MFEPQIEIVEKNGDLFAVRDGKPQAWHTTTESGKIVVGKLIWDESITDGKMFWRVYGDGVHDVFPRKLSEQWAQHRSIKSGANLIPTNIIAFAVDQEEANLYNAKLAY